MNSVFVQPGVYSCAIDCFLEVSTYLFLPVLSKLSVRSIFPELLFADAAANNSSGNILRTLNFDKTGRNKYVDTSRKQSIAQE